MNTPSQTAYRNELAKADHGLGSDKNEIPAEMDTLMVSIKRLHELVERLHLRIEPVLKDCPSLVECRKELPPLASKVALELRDATCGIHNISDLVEGMTSRVAL